MKKIYPFIFSLVFWGILLVPNLKPGISIDTYGKDLFGHDQLIDGFNTLRLKLGDRVFPEVIAGKNGWFFYTGDGLMFNYQGANPYKIRDLIEIGNRFEALDQQLKQRGILLVVIVAPDKSSIYPEYMPDQIVKIGDQSRLDQIIDYMHKNEKIPTIDLRPDLLAAAKSEQVFYKTDTHWNPSAEYIVYTKLLSVLSQYYPGLAPHPLSDFKVIDSGMQTRDLPRLLGMPEIKEDTRHLQPLFDSRTNIEDIPLADGTDVRFTTNQDQDLPSVVIYHDSFLNEILPLLEPHFSRTISIFRNHIPGVWSMKWIDQAKPDIVIYEYVERYTNYGIYLPGN